MSAERTPSERWRIVQLARHPSRPKCLDYIERLFPDFIELRGDRVSGEDAAIVGGPATLSDRPVMLIVHARGRSREEQLARNDGMARPAGFRKAARLVELAERLGLPVVTLLDTPGAYPGTEAEEHGQAMAISSLIEALVRVKVPTIACVVGEGGSGGALALAVSDRLMMLENAIFPVISPEACSAILFRDDTHAEELADSLRLTASDLLSLRLIDEIVAEPSGGAHTDPELATRLLRAALDGALQSLLTVPPDLLRSTRRSRFASFGRA